MTELQIWVAMYLLCGASQSHRELKWQVRFHAVGGPSAMFWLVLNG